MTVSIQRKISLLYGLLQASFWGGACVSTAFAAYCLGSRGYSNAEIGFVVAGATLAGAVVSLRLSEKLDIKAPAFIFSAIYAMLGLQILAALAVILFPYRCGVSAAGFAVLVMLAFAVNPVYIKLYVDLCHNGFAVNFSAVRSAGSLAYALVSLLMGALIRYGLGTCAPLLCAVFALVQIALCKRIKASCGELTGGERAGHGQNMLWGLLRGNPRFVVLLVGLALMFAAVNAAGTYMINVIELLGGRPDMLGSLTGISVLAETAAMLLYGKIRKKRVRTVLLISIVFFAVKIICIAFSRSLSFLYLAACLQSVSFGLYTPAIVEYIERITAYGDAGKAQSLALNMQTLGTVIATLMCGVLLDCLVTRSVLYILAGLAAAGALVSLCGVERELPENGNNP